MYEYKNTIYVEQDTLPEHVEEIQTFIILVCQKNANRRRYLERKSIILSLDAIMDNDGIRNINLYELVLSKLGHSEQYFISDFIHQIENEQISRAFLALTKKQQLVLDLYYRCGFTVVEIASQLKMTHQAVTSMKNRAIENIRSSLLKK